MDKLITIVFGLILRIGIPLAISALIFYFLRRLDQRWQKQAMALPVVAIGKPCWELKGCSEEKRKDCPATQNKNVPCWQVFRTKNGLLREACLDCDVFRLALGSHSIFITE